jgi:hypothetical protein
MRPRFAVPWYGPGDWRALRLVAVDPEDLEASYEEWARLSALSCSELAADGFDVERIHVETEALIRWCVERCVPLDGRARAQFAWFTLANGGGKKLGLVGRESPLPVAAASCPGASKPRP